MSPSLSAPMPSVLHFPNRRARAAVSVVLLLATVLVLVVEHVTVSVTVGEAKTPEVVLVTAAGLEVRAIATRTQPAPVAHPKIVSRGPGGSQPWVRWNYIP